MVAMNIKTAVDQIAQTAGIAPAAAEQAAGIILSVIAQELDPGTSASLFARLSGAEALAANHPVNVSAGGFLASIAGTVMGAKVGVAAAGIAELRSTGLSLAQIETAGATLLSYVKANGGSKLATQIAAALPSMLTAA